MARAIHLEILRFLSPSSFQVTSTLGNSHDFAEAYTGSAVYIYTILARGSSTEVTIALDGNVVGNFASTPDETLSSFTYNFPIFSMNGISSGEHTVTVQTTGSNVNQVLFDYAIYS